MNTRRVLAFILCTITLDVLALGLMIPVMPQLVLSLMAGNVAGAAEVIGLFATTAGLLQFLCSPLLGALSDRYGRRPVILLSCLGLGLDYVFMAVAPSLLLLYIGRIISAVTSATLTTAAAYITDVTPPERRARALGLIGIGFSLGFILGPAVGGLLASIDLRLPFWVSAAASLANAAFGWFVLPESLPAERRMAFSWKRANPIGALKLLATHSQLLGLAATNFLAQVAHQALPSVFVLYAAYRYGWDERAVGFTLAFVGICSAAVLGGLVGPAVARFGERRTLLFGLALGALGMAIFGLAPTGAWFLLGVPVIALWSLSTPSAQALMTRLVGSSEQGQLQGANMSLTSIGGLIGPGLFTLTFAHFIGHRPDGVEFPGATFLLAAAILLMAAGTAWTVTAPRPSAARPR